MIKIENLSFQYSSGTQALRDVTIELPPAHILAILGESGSGKTTLLQCIGRFLTPQSGRITLHGRDIRELPEVEFRKAIGIVFQKLHLFPHLTILENLMLAPTTVLGRPRPEVRDDAHEMLNRLGIPELSDSYPSQTSGGQAQRAAIARSLMLKPEYLLLDEPTSALDINTTEEFGKWLVELKSDTTFVIVTHDIPFARKTAQSGVMIANGCIQGQGSIEELIRA